MCKFSTLFGMMNGCLIRLVPTVVSAVYFPGHYIVVNDIIEPPRPHGGIKSLHYCPMGKGQCLCRSLLCPPCRLFTFLSLQLSSSRKPAPTHHCIPSPKKRFIVCVCIKGDTGHHYFMLSVWVVPYVHKVLVFACTGVEGQHLLCGADVSVGCHTI